MEGPNKHEYDMVMKIIKDRSLTSKQENSKAHAKSLFGAKPLRGCEAVQDRYRSQVQEAWSDGGLLG